MSQPVPTPPQFGQPLPQRPPFMILVIAGIMFLTGIDAFLKENYLQFLGFNLDIRVVEQFRARFPNDKAMNDLKLWHIFEMENPDTFASMYQFWIQKSH